MLHAPAAPDLSAYMTSAAMSAAMNANFQRDRQQTTITGTYTWVFPVPYASGVVPICEAIVEAPVGSTDVINVQLDGAPTNTQAKFRVTRTQQSVVALIGLTILSIPTSVGVQWLHMTARAP